MLLLEFYLSLSYFKKAFVRLLKNGEFPCPQTAFKVCKIVCTRKLLSLHCVVLANIHIFFSFSLRLITVLFLICLLMHNRITHFNCFKPENDIRHFFFYLPTILMIFLFLYIFCGCNKLAVSDC